jgi:hypothetical protein
LLQGLRVSLSQTADLPIDGGIAQAVTCAVLKVLGVAAGEGRAGCLLPQFLLTFFFANLGNAPAYRDAGDLCLPRSSLFPSGSGLLGTGENPLRQIFMITFVL